MSVSQVRRNGQVRQRAPRDADRAGKFQTPNDSMIPRPTQTQTSFLPSFPPCRGCCQPSFLPHARIFARIAADIHRTIAHAPRRGRNQPGEGSRSLLAFVSRGLVSSSRRRRSPWRRRRQRRRPRTRLRRDSRSRRPTSTGRGTRHGSPSIERGITIFFLYYCSGLPGGCSNSRLCIFLAFSLAVVAVLH